MKKIIFAWMALVFLGSCNSKTGADTAESNSLDTLEVVTSETFIRAETDLAFQKMITNAGQTNTFFHFRTPTPLDNQSVVRMNQDVLYSGGVFDAKEGLDITFPDLPDDRYASIYILDNDHYVQELIYEPGQYQVKGNTDFLYIIVRLQVYKADDEQEILMLNKLQDQFIVKSKSGREFPSLKWDLNSLDSLRAQYNEESTKYSSWEGMMGKRGQVNENTRHIAAAAAWGLLPEEAATYLNYAPKETKANTCYTATYRVPENKGFWSITVYGGDGFIKSENSLLNNSNVKLNPDGTFTVHFGSKESCGEVLNRLDAPEGWNFLFRVYLPGQEVLKGEFKLPEVVAVD